MNADGPDHPSEPGFAPPGGAGAPSEEELRAAYEAELSRVTATDILAQTVISLLNVGARRLGLAAEPQSDGTPGVGSEPDLEQVRDAIDGARALLAILERTIPQELGPLRDALSRLQMAYAREVQPGAGENPAAASDGAPAGAQPAGEEAPGATQPPAGGGPGPAESSGRLWVPGR
jgi:hypothetical protein